MEGGVGEREVAMVGAMIVAFADQFIQDCGRLVFLKGRAQLSSTLDLGSPGTKSPGQR